MPALMPDQLARDFDPRRVAARDRRISAIHEAGHVVAAQWRSVAMPMAFIWPSGFDGHEYKSWLGSMVNDPTTAENSRLIGVAGAIAEHIWLGHADTYICNIALWESEEACRMSPADWQNTRTTPGKPDRKFMTAVRSVHKQFAGPLWPEVCRVARALIVRSRSLRPFEITALQENQGDNHGFPGAEVTIFPKR
jgi:hypothetical protein